MVSNQWLFIIGLGLSSMLPRILPLYLLKGRTFSPKLVKWMSYIPVTIFTALVFNDIFFWNSQFSLNPLVNLKLIPSIIVAFVAAKIDNLFVSMIVGVIAIALMVWGFA